MLHPVFPQLPSMGLLHVWQIDLDRDWGISQFLSADELERYSRFKHPIHKDRFARGRRELRFLIGRYFDLDPALLRFKYSSTGKPSLERSPFDRPFYFNVSHSESIMLAGFSTGGEIGIDVETNRSLSDESGTMKRFFSQSEIGEYSSLPESLRSQGFANAWTRKEAILKATGAGLQTPLDSFSVALDPRKPCEIEDITSFKDDSISWSLIDLSEHPRYTAAVAAQSEITKIMSLIFGDPKSETIKLTYSH